MECHAFTLEAPQDMFGRRDAHIFSRNINRREWRVGVRRELEIVEPDNGNLIGHLQAAHPAFDQRAQRENVVAA